MTEVDFEAEGLLEGLEGEARDARERLLAELAEDGVPLEELRTAVAEDRLALLPVERILSGGGEKFTAAQVAERAGVEKEFLDREWRALGMALAGDDVPAYTERDVEAAKRVQTLRDAGIPDDGVLEVARLMGMTMSQLAAANRRLIADAFMQEGDTEYDVAMRFAAATRAFMPLVGESLSYVLALHLREQIRHDAFGIAELSSGRAAGADEATVCFADMVGFTQLGETLEPEELGSVTGRLGELAAAAVEPPVRLVKLLGDAAMLVGPEPRPVVEAALGLVEAAESEGENFPLLRAGVASGRALPRAGDWYGRPVNLASRITSIARPASVLASEDLRDSLREDYKWSYAGSRRLKGIDGEVKLFRCRRPESRS
jgi:adenylate cyclase